MTKRSHRAELRAKPIKAPTDPKTAEKVFQAAVKCLKGEEPEPSGECGFCGWVGMY